MALLYESMVNLCFQYSAYHRKLYKRAFYSTLDVYEMTSCIFGNSKGLGVAM